MAETLLIGSGNKDKAAELARLLEGLPWEVKSLRDYPDIEEPEETGETFENNAALKARYYGEAFGVTCVADDSGISVDALDGAPGVYSARYAGEVCTYNDNNVKLLGALENVADDERGAQFVCCAALYRDGEVAKIERGEVRGTISRACAGEYGFGYDPLFIPENESRTFAEMSPEEKHALSHRGRAFAKMKAYLETIAMNIVAPDDEGIGKAASAVARGEVVVYPTETVYGLAVDPHDDTAVARLFEVKGRPADVPVLVLVSSLDALAGIVGQVSDRAQSMMDAFWPGPISLVLPSAKNLSPALTAGSDKICVRLAAHPIAKALCDASGGVITSTSANATGQPAALSVHELETGRRCHCYRWRHALVFRAVHRVRSGYRRDFSRRRHHTRSHRQDLREP